MLRRMNRASLAIITAIAIIVATVGVVYALQTIFQTSGISAKVNIVTGADRIRVCSDADTNCTTPFTGDLNFGNMLPGTSRSVFPRVKNILTGGLAAPVFVDIRIDFPAAVSSSDRVTPLNNSKCLDFPDFPFLCGDVPNLGTFLVEVTVISPFPRSTTVLQPQEVALLQIRYTTAPNLPPGPLAFDILVDAVDVTE